MWHRCMQRLNLIFKWVNSLFAGRPRWVAVVSRAFMATALGLTLSVWLVDALVLSTTSMFSSPEKRDFQLPDLFAQIADNRPVRKYDDRIIIVDIGHSDRLGIAEGLSLLSLCGPKAVGVDINFADPGEYDTVLTDALTSCPNLVLPLGVGPTKEQGEYKITDKPFFYNDLKDIHYGIVNFPMNANKGTIREYAITFPTDQGIIPSYAKALAEIADPEVVEVLDSREEPTGVTEYHSREYKTVHIEDIEEHAEDFADKIVLVGALEDAGDMHATTIKSHVAGILLHAAALSTMLDKTWYVKIPKTADYLIAVSLCFILMVVAYSFKNNLKGITIRILQGLLAFLAVRVGYELFVDHYVILDLSFTIMIIAFGFLAADIWNGIETLWHIGAEKLETKYN